MMLLGFFAKRAPRYLFSGAFLHLCPEKRADPYLFAQLARLAKLSLFP